MEKNLKALENKTTDQEGPATDLVGQKTVQNGYLSDAAVMTAPWVTMQVTGNQFILSWRWYVWSPLTTRLIGKMTQVEYKAHYTKGYQDRCE